MQNVYLVEQYRKDGTYHSTTKLAFTSRAAAEKYAKEYVNETYQAQIVKVSLISLYNY